MQDEILGGLKPDMSRDGMVGVPDVEGEHMPVAFFGVGLEAEERGTACLADGGDLGHRLVMVENEVGSVDVEERVEVGDHLAVAG